jgi:hypothetical protein
VFFKIKKLHFVLNIGGFLLGLRNMGKEIGEAFQEILL